MEGGMLKHPCPSLIDEMDKKYIWTQNSASWPFWRIQWAQQTLASEKCTSVGMVVFWKLGWGVLIMSPRSSWVPDMEVFRHKLAWTERSDFHLNPSSTPFTVWPYASYWTLLSRSFLVCKMRVTGDISCRGSTRETVRKGHGTEPDTQQALIGGWLFLLVPWTSMELCTRQIKDTPSLWCLHTSCKNGFYLEPLRTVKLHTKGRKHIVCIIHPQGNRTKT